MLHRREPRFRNVGAGLLEKFSFLGSLKYLFCFNSNHPLCTITLPTPCGSESRFLNKNIHHIHLGRRRAQHMKTLYRLLALLLLASISHQLNAAPTKDIGQSAISSVSLQTPADIAISPAIFSTSNIQLSCILPGIVITSNVNNSTYGTTAGSQYNQGAKQNNCANKNWIQHGGLANGDYVFTVANSATTANTTTATDDDSGQCLDQNSAAATTTWTAHDYDISATQNCNTTASATNTSVQNC